jgi:hypothetical protein
MLNFSLSDINPQNAMLAREILRDMDAVLSRIANGGRSFHEPEALETPQKKVIEKPTPKLVKETAPAEDLDEDNDLSSEPEDVAARKAVSDAAKKKIDAKAKKEATDKKAAKAIAAQPVDATDYSDLDRKALIAAAKERCPVICRAHDNGRDWLMGYFKSADVQGYTGFDDDGLRDFLMASDAFISGEAN